MKNLIYVKKVLKELLNENYCEVVFNLKKYFIVDDGYLMLINNEYYSENEYNYYYLKCNVDDNCYQLEKWTFYYGDYELLNIYN